MAASARWMIQRENRRSGFWQMAELLDPTRQSLAWTNLSKMDRIGGRKPPEPSEWASIAKECKTAFAEEIEHLRPGVTVLTTSSIYAEDVAEVLAQFSFEPTLCEIDDGFTSVYTNGRSYVVSTKHPQGWGREQRKNVIELVRKLQLAVCFEKHESYSMFQGQNE